MAEFVFAILIMYVLPFPLHKSYLMLLFWVVTIGMILSFILSIKNIGRNRWRWVTLFGMEIFGLVCANVESRWGYVPVKYGWAALGPAECEIARMGVVYFSLQVVATLIMFICFCIRKKNQPQKPPEPPKPPERPFCGDF